MHTKKQKIQPIFSLLLAVVLVLGCLTPSALAATPTADAVVFEVTSYTTSATLSTDVEITDYFGNVSVETVTDIPTSGYQYLILDLDITVPYGVGGFLLADLVVAEERGAQYTMLDNGFLKSHNYAPITSATLSGGVHSGHVAYEVPVDATIEALVVDSGVQTVSLGDVSHQQGDAGIIGDTNIALNTIADIQASQNAVDKKIEDALATGQYTIDAPYLLLNPYGNAPLTALACFTTDYEADITVSVESADAYGAVEYTPETDGNTHLVPILGLYPNAQNRVTLTAKGARGKTQSARLDVQTGTLPRDMPKWEVAVQNMAEEDAHLTQITYGNGYNCILDYHGNIRWYYGTKTTLSFEYMENGHLLLYRENLSGVGNEYTNKTAFLYEVDMLGKLYHVYDLKEHMHHEFTYLGNNKIAYTGNNDRGTGLQDGVKLFNLATNTVEEVFDFSTLLDRYYCGYTDKVDWFHVNSVSWDQNRDSFVVSGRQYGIVELNAQREVTWILGHYGDRDPAIMPYLLTPVDAVGDPLYDMTTAEGIAQANHDFFPWGQHGIEYAPDLDNDTSTIEIMFFDNHHNPHVPDELHANLSRGVVYSINPTNMTVEMLSQFGAEFGPAFYSPTLSDNNILENGHRLILSGDLQNDPGYKGRLVEVDDTNQVLWDLKCDRSVWIAESVGIYPDGYQVALHTDLEREAYNPFLTMSDVPCPADFTESALNVESLALTKLDSGNLLLKGALEDFAFARQLGYISLFQADGTCEVYGFVVGNGNEIFDIVTLVHTEYAQYQITVVDEKAQTIYQSAMLPFAPVHQMHQWEERPSDAVVKMHIDDLVLNPDQEKLQIHGWAYLDRINSSETTELRTVFVGENQSFARPIPAGVRTYVTASHGGGVYNYDHCGLYEDVSIATLPDDTYRLGIEVKTGDTVGFIDTGYYFELDRDKKPVVAPVASTDLLEQQSAVNQRLQAAYEAGNYTLETPFVNVDPYELSPLSAIAMFKTTQPAKISISVAGLNGGKTITNDFGNMATDHTIPIYGLYAEQETNVTLTATYGDGTTDTNVLAISGNPLPDLLDAMSVDYVAEGAADDLIFCQPPSRVGVAYAIDNTGAIRWVFSDKEIAVATAMIQLANGHFLTNSEKTMGSLYAESIYEMDYTGRIYKEYMINNVHHDTAVMPNGNILAVSGDYDNETLEDAVFELDGETGEVLRYWDLTSYFPVGNRNEAGELVSDVNYGSKTLDWFHINSIEYRESDNSMVLSGRLQDAVIKINLDTGELAWILSDHDDLWPDALKDKLLTPVGDLTDFEWQFGQHNATWLPNGDLMLFDNGTWRSKDKEGIPPLEESYSRVVVYRIDEAAGTVEHVWQYGKELGHDYLSTFISSAQYLGENHYFMDFGGGQTDANGVHQYLGGPNRHAQIVELKDGVEVFKASNESIGITAGTYQALRLNIYNGTNELDLTQTGIRLSSNFKSNYVEESTLDTTPTNTFDVDRLSLEDNGTQLELFATLTDVAETDTMYLYMVGEGTYRFPVEPKTTIQTKLNSTEVPVGQYRLYLTKNDAICDLEQVWNVDVAATPVPTCYDITVANSNLDAGWTSESGFYCKNTAVTLTAKANDGYTFSGWKKNGVTVSTQPTYSFLPTADATFTAVFADESAGDVGDGSLGGGGGSVGGGSVGGGSVGGGSVGGDSTGGDTVTTPTFTDVDPDAYYYDAILWAVEHGITDGTSDTTFSPDDVCTRAQAVTFLWNQAGKPVVDYAMTFTDVSGDSWYTEAIRWAVSEGITNGTSDTTFSPDALCTRGQIVTLLWNAAGKPVADQASLFTDVATDIWYADAIQWAAAQTITTGTTDTTFSPTDNCTRGQIVTFLYRNP